MTNRCRVSRDLILAGSSKSNVNPDLRLLLIVFCQVKDHGRPENMYISADISKDEWCFSLVSV